MIARILIGSVCVLGFVVDATAQSSAPQQPPVLLQMIRDDAVHQELGLRREQVAQLMSALGQVDPPWFRSRNLPPDKQQTEIDSLTSQLRVSLDSILDDDQLDRLSQLERQALGTRMVLRDDVATALNLSDKQRDGLIATFLETDQESMAIQKAVAKGEKDANAGNRELERLKTKERQWLVARLTDEQKSRMGALTGEPFSFSQIRRTYPLAPELTNEGGVWVQGGPIDLNQLRGKVVAVHFYAFQCINCQRNFEHYQGWHEDYADKDLVVIGIQTPETSAERQLDRVSAAVKSDGMTYPVLFDGQSNNWRGWSNTMWPTVYLIDRKGFLRRWWQGELNWQGNPGEQQMRETIEQLLAEQP